MDCSPKARGFAANLLRALGLRDMTDREEDRRLRERVHRHLQEAGEIRERPAEAEREGNDAHVLDRGIGEKAFDVAAAVQHEAAKTSETRPMSIISGLGASAWGLAASKILNRNSA